jgi:hypothetical protein
MSQSPVGTLNDVLGVAGTLGERIFLIDTVDQRPI